MFWRPKKVSGIGAKGARQARFSGLTGIWLKAI
jgi:hypothetical protein